MKALIRNLLLMLILAMPASMQAQFQYITNANGTSITITGYAGSPPGIIPPTINSLPVTGIGNAAFEESYGLTSVTIPGSVTSIGEEAFAGCRSLTNVTIPGSLISVGEYAFAGTALTSVTIPGSVTNVGLGAFQGCTSLTAITVDAQNSFYSTTNGVLFDKNQTTLIEAPGGLAESYEIPATVTNIDDYAFYYCTALTNVTIPESVSNIGAGTFGECYSLARVTIPASVSSIGDNAFAYCYDLVNVTIPGSVSNVGVSSFEWCTSLTNATISIGVSSLESNAFANCTALASVTIPGSVTNIGDYAFGYSDDLIQVYFTGNAPVADGTAFLDIGYNGMGPYAYYVTTAYYSPGTTGWAEFSANTGIPAVLWNPLIQADGASFGVRSNQFGFNITGTTNIPIVVEGCTNLAQPVWVPLQSMTLTNGLVHFSEPVETNSAARFYRISAP